MAVELVQILRRSPQGVTEPFICRGDDDLTYYVKGKNAGNASLVKELVCGQLAKFLNLPIAPFEVVVVPPKLIGIESELNPSELGSGFAFGSLEQTYASEISLANVQKIPTETRRDIVVFDVWIMNSDRTLSEAGGNPNLLWSDRLDAVAIIDHNNAFDTNEPIERLVDHHIFKAEFDLVLNDRVLRKQYDDRFNRALDRWLHIAASVPEAWLFADHMQTVPVEPTLEDMFQILTRHRAGGLWP